MNDLTLVDEAYEIFAANFNFILDPLEPNKTLKFVVLKSILVRYLFGKNRTETLFKIKFLCMNDVN